MITTLIVLILVVIFLAFFIGFNVQNQATVWFFSTYSNVPVVLIIFISFAAGVAIALLIALIAKLRSPSKKEVEKDSAKEEKDKNKDLKEKIKKLESKKGFKFKKNNTDKNTTVTSESKEVTNSGDSN